METIIIHIEDKEKSKALKNMLKAFKVDFMANDKITKETIQVASSIRKGFEEAKSIQKGKLKSQSLEDLLDEL